MIGIVDYNAGNIKSVERVLTYLNAPYILSKNPADLKNADKIIIPGVGEAKFAMDQMKKTGFDSFIKDWYAASKPMIGICLGSQIVFDFSEEGDVDCLGLIPGKIRHFTSLWKERHVSPDEKIDYPVLQGPNLKVPHIGFNDLSYTNGECQLLQGVPEHSDFYFVHSYVIQPQNPEVIKAYADYGTMVPAVVQSGSLTVFQFHPEKSGEPGLKILKNFAEL